MGVTMISQMLGHMNFGRTIAALWLPHGDSTFSPGVQFLWDFWYWISVFFTVLIVGLVVSFSIRYRHTKDRTIAENSPSHNNSLEITWTIIPFIIVMVIFALGFKDYMNMDSPPANSYNIHVIAQKWSWTFVYENGAISNTLYLPVNKPVRLNMTSKDVLHGFWIPDLSIQRDVVPGRVMTTWVEATHPGKYILQCAEYCGDGHSEMRANVVAEAYPKFQHQIVAAANIFEENGKPLPLATVGKKLYVTLGCLGCHSVDGSKGTGPSWKNLAGSKEVLTNGHSVSVDYAFLKTMITHPGRVLIKGFPAGVMPSYGSRFTGKNVKNLYAVVWYINSLSKYSNKASQPPVPNESGGAEPATSSKAAAAPATVAPAAAVKAASPVAKVPSGPKPIPLHVLGAKLYKSLGCIGCHTVNGQPGVGPTWKNLAGYPQKLTTGKTVIADYKFLRTMILDPGTMDVVGVPAGVMPNMYKYQLSGKKHPHETKLNALIWYINTLSNRSSKATQPPVPDVPAVK
ncbi:MAG: cytochrome c oxidase subunit II [Phycisphaerae bacterium]